MTSLPWARWVPVGQNPERTEPDKRLCCYRPSLPRVSTTEVPLRKRLRHDQATTDPLPDSLPLLLGGGTRLRAVRTPG